MTGAISLVETLLASGVDHCFANPGTSEMHFVAALDSHPDMRCILCLFEGGATGAADGYFRMSGDVAATLLHLAPGFGNGYANLHNARKGRSAVLNVVGDHATHHLKYDAPLKGDLAGVAGSVSHWVRSSPDSGSVAIDGAAAVSAARARGGQVSTLILPADTAWGDADGPRTAGPPPPRHRPSEAEIAAAADLLRQPGSALFVNFEALLGDAAETAARIASTTGARLMMPFFAPRIDLGEGAVDIERIAYRPEDSAEILKDVAALVLLGSDRPVNFFAYPGLPSTPEPPGCRIHDLCDPFGDIGWTLDRLAEATGAGPDATVARIPLDLPERPTGPLDAEGIGQALACTLPENAIVADESVTVGTAIAPRLRTARRHDHIRTTGGSIGDGLPLALGAAVACPDRPVVALSGDGSAMYTIQCLWTMAREELDVVVVVFANRGYQILRYELSAMGAPDYGRNAARMFDIVDPELDWVALAQGHGVPGERVTTNEAFCAALETGYARKGPYFIECALEPPPA